MRKFLGKCMENYVRNSAVPFCYWINIYLYKNGYGNFGLRLTYLVSPTCDQAFFSEKARESAKPTTEKEALDRRLGSLGQERLTKP